MKRMLSLLTFPLALSILSNCASYRTFSNNILRTYDEQHVTIVCENDTNCKYIFHDFNTVIIYTPEEWQKSQQEKTDRNMQRGWFEKWE